MPSTACWSSDARSPSASSDPRTGLGQLCSHPWSMQHGHTIASSARSRVRTSSGVMRSRACRDLFSLRPAVRLPEEAPLWLLVDRPSVRVTAVYRPADLETSSAVSWSSTTANMRQEQELNHDGRPAVSYPNTG